MKEALTALGIFFIAIGIVKLVIYAIVRTKG
jgi:hypothetical protein